MDAAICYGWTALVEDWDVSEAEAVLREEMAEEERRGFRAWCLATTCHGVVDLYLTRHRNVAVKVSITC